MQASNAPSKSPVPFAESGSKNTIPVASQIGVTPGLASFTDGFPPLTMTPLVAGGIPPKGMDFNGILYFLSAAVRWSQAGGRYTFDAAFATAVGGYPKGAVLAAASGNGSWLNLVDNNTSNPDSGGANWVSLGAGIATTAQAQALTDNTVLMTPSNLVSAMDILRGSQAFIASGTFVVPAGVSVLYITGCGAGGGGAAYNGSTSGGGGGGAGGSCLKAKVTVTPGATISVTIGSGGGGGQTANASGTAGGATSFGSLVTLSGGAGGASAAAGGIGGGVSGATGQVIASGQRGEQYNPLSLSQSQGGHGGSTMFGVGGYGGGQGSGNLSGQGAQGFGSGGGGGAQGVGGSGANGFLIVEW